MGYYAAQRRDVGHTVCYNFPLVLMPGVDKEADG